MERIEEFTRWRPLLFAIAYRILGSVSEAEDAVQETWVRYQSTATVPTSPKLYLSTVVTRISIDVLRSARARRERYVGPWFPEPLMEDLYQDPERSAELADSISMASLLLLERLSPLERATFVLREVFGYEYAEIATAVQRSEAACRQLVARARRHLQHGQRRFAVDAPAHQELASRFVKAFRTGDVDGLEKLLTADVVIVADGGGKAPALLRPVRGREQVARMLAAVGLRLQGIVALEARLVNHQPGVLLTDPSGAILAVMALDVIGGQVEVLRSVMNPDKLAHLGPVADAWALDNQVRPSRSRG